MTDTSQSQARHGREPRQADYSRRYDRPDQVEKQRDGEPARPARARAPYGKVFTVESSLPIEVVRQTPEQECGSPRGSNAEARRYAAASETPSCV